MAQKPKKMMRKLFAIHVIQVVECKEPRNKRLLVDLYNVLTAVNEDILTELIYYQNCEVNISI